MIKYTARGATSSTAGSAASGYKHTNTIEISDRCADDMRTVLDEAAQTVYVYGCVCGV